MRAEMACGVVIEVEENAATNEILHVVRIPRDFFSTRTQPSPLAGMLQGDKKRALDLLLNAVLLTYGKEMKDEPDMMTATEVMNRWEALLGAPRKLGE